MGLFNSPPLILVLKINSLELYSPGRGYLGKVEFAPNVLNHLQIISIRRFNSEVVSFLSRFKAQKAILLLSPEVVQSGRNIYKTLIITLGRIGWKAYPVIPLSVFGGLANKEKLNHEDIDYILSNLKSLKSYNLVHFKNMGFKISKNIYFLIITIGLLSLGSVFFISKNHPKLTPITTEVTPTPSPVASPSSQLPSPSPSLTPSPTASASAEIAKENLKMEILNGSGITGQSSKLRDQLLTKGYKNIETGNDFGNKNTSTDVIFSLNVQKNIQDDIIKFLKKNFTNVASSVEDTLTKFDIIITTAKN